MTSRITAGWQLILADLALILFLVTLAALASAIEQNEETPDFIDGSIKRSATDGFATAPVQALYRPTEGIIPFGEWLSGQPNDPRAQLTIYASYSGKAEGETWQKVQSMASDAQNIGISTKIIIAPSERDDIYASFAFDRSARPNG